MTMYYKEGDCKKLYPVYGAFIGIVLFIAIYGVRILNPFYVDWLLGRGDLSQHYLGWEFFRRSDWKFPIGLTNRLAYPIETSVIFTDSIPLLAVPLKLLNRFLPDHFQYFGFWGILSFGLQGFYAAKILNVLNTDWRCTVIGDIIIVASPLVIYRMFMHTSLGAQWVILIAIYLFLRYDYRSGGVKAAVYWGLLGFLVTGIHLYFFPMCFLFVTGYMVKSMTDAKRVKIGYIAPVITFTLGACLNLFILGGLSSGASAGAYGFSDFSFNLNSFWNPRGFSRILPEADSVSGLQQEGFAYLGLGAVCLIIVSLSAVLVHGMKKRQNIIKMHLTNSTNVILGIIGIISVFVAASPVITFGSKVLIEIPVGSLVSYVWSFFRSTGRFIWPVWYLLIIYSVKNIEILPIKAASVVLIICTAVQLFDISGAMADRHRRFAKETVYEYADDEFWQQLTEYRDFRHICISFPDEIIDKWLKIGAIAQKYDLTTNAFYFARSIDGMRDNTEVLNRELPADDTIYVFLPEQTEMLERNVHNLRYYEVGDFVIGVTWLDNEGKVNDFSYE